MALARRCGRSAGGGAGLAAGTLALTQTAIGGCAFGTGLWTRFLRIPGPSRGKDFSFGSTQLRQRRQSWCSRKTWCSRSCRILPPLPPLRSPAAPAGSGRATQRVFSSRNSWDARPEVAWEGFRGQPLISTCAVPGWTRASEPQVEGGRPGGAAERWGTRNGAESGRG